ncbi:hypothetical protein BOSEA31B_14976 [Hyphomicrobiales bacterium]|nr:hypothetical protein BOSEA31B_14976 [Hyphomicrobiales bacterium]CAH1701462.1 hypothetical protein BOSEA1005_21161 [Hyphomicrobiales bacterium]CAI0345419.1 hypothetical protein BO1005MUT1_390091 [Hyphomicrobiales bacterium]
MARSGRQTPEGRDDHYRDLDRLLGAPAAASRRRFKSDCPEPGAFTISEEIFWLAVLLAQMRWPWPRDIANALADAARSTRFSVEQGRYLLRYDADVTVLSAAQAGASITGWPADLASRRLVHMARDRELPGEDALTGRWPLPLGQERSQWEEAKNTFFRTRQRHLTRDEKVAWLCLAYGQMGWPLPSALTRFFPIDWTIRKMDSGLLAQALDNITVADAVLAGACVKGLDRDALLKAAESWTGYERSRKAEAKAGDIPAFVMFRDKLARAGAQGRLYRLLFDDAQKVLQSFGQQPDERLQLMTFINRQATVDRELAEQASPSQPLRLQERVGGFRVVQPQDPAPTALPKRKFRPPDLRGVPGIVVERPSDDDDPETVEDDVDLDDMMTADEDGADHEDPGADLDETSLDGLPITSAPGALASVADPSGGGLPSMTDGTTDATDEAASALPISLPFSSTSPAIDQDAIGIEATATVGAPGRSQSAADASTDRGGTDAGEPVGATGTAGSLTKVAHHNAPADASEPPSPALDEGERLAAVDQVPSAPSRPQDRSADEPPQEGLPTVADQADLVDEELAWLMSPDSSFSRNRQRPSMRYAAPVMVTAALASEPAASAGRPADLGSVNAEPRANGDMVQTKNIDDHPGPRKTTSPPVSLTSPEIEQQPGSGESFVTNQGLIASGAIQPPLVTQLKSDDADRHRASSERVSPPSAPKTSSPSQQAPRLGSRTNGSEPVKSEPARHERAHPNAVERHYRHDVVQPEGLKKPIGYEYERLKVKLDEAPAPTGLSPQKDDEDEAP